MGIAKCYPVLSHIIPKYHITAFKMHIDILQQVTGCSLEEVDDILEQPLRDCGLLLVGVFTGFIFCPEDGGRIFFRNIIVLLPDYVTSQFMILVEM
jgi:hypothetical protein